MTSDPYSARSGLENIPESGPLDLPGRLLLPPTSRQYNDSFWVSHTRDTQAKTAAAYGFLAVRDTHSNVQRLAGGRLLRRIHLWTAGHGLSLGHMNQITERIDRERQLPMSRSERAGAAPGERRWVRALAVVLGGYYVLLGAAYLSKPSGAVGILCGLVVWAALCATRRSQPVAWGLLALGAVPFAVLTWWSVVTPLIAVLLLAIGTAAIRADMPGQPAPGPLVDGAGQPASGPLV